MSKIIEAKNVGKKYIVGSNEIDALSDMSFDINEGEFVVVLGPSGAGKTTLLNLSGGSTICGSPQWIPSSLSV